MTSQEIINVTQTTISEDAPKFKVYTARQLDKIEPLKSLPDSVREEMEIVAEVLPF